jgi:hypothetical protein
MVAPIQVAHDIGNTFIMAGDNCAAEVRRRFLALLVSNDFLLK